MNPKILGETPLSSFEVKKELAKILKRDGQLSIRSQKTDEFLNQFPVVKNYDTISKTLSGLNIPRLKEQHISKIIDIMPMSLDELKVVLQGYTITVSKENMDKIM